MTSRERIDLALSHRQPDMIPVDFGSTAITGMHVSCVAALRDYYGLEKRPVKVCEPYQMLGEIEDDLLDVLGVDTVAFPSLGTIFGFRNENYKPFNAPWGLELLAPENFKTTTDNSGNLFIYPQGDMNVPPSGHMPAGGVFFDAIIRQEPIDDDNLNPADNLEEFGLLSSNDLIFYATHAARLTSSGRAVVGGIGGTGLGDIALVPAPFLKHPKGIRDIQEWYMSTAIRRDYLHAIFEKQCEIAVENLKRFNDVAGAVLSVIYICGTDF